MGLAFIGPSPCFVSALNNKSLILSHKPSSSQDFKTCVKRNSSHQRLNHYYLSHHGYLKITAPYSWGVFVIVPTIASFGCHYEILAVHWPIEFLLQPAFTKTHGFLRNTVAFATDHGTGTTADRMNSYL